MIIKCDNCGTKFRLDDSKVTETGVRVRCSRCSHTFIVRKETPADDGTFDALLADFGSTSAEDESQEKTDSFDQREFEPEPSAQGRSPEPPVPADFFAGSSPEEPSLQQTGTSEAWDENGDEGGAAPEPPFSAPEPIAAAETVTPADPLEGFVRQGVTLPQFSLSETPAEKAEEEVSPVFEPEVPVQESEPTAETEAPTEPFGGFFQKGVALPQFRETGMPAGEAVAATGSPRPDEWGIFAASTLESPGNDATEIRDQRHTAAEDHELPPLSIASRRRGSPLAALLLGVLLILIIALAASAFISKWPFDPAAVIPPSVMKMIGSACKTGECTEIRSLKGEFVTSREGGDLFAVTGEVANTSARVLAALRVRGTVYDSNGQILAQRTVYCGNSLTRDQMATLPFPEIEKAMSRQFGDSLANLDVAPGKSIPFMVVFKGVPRGGANYGVMVVNGQGAEPGRK